VLIRQQLTKLELIWITIVREMGKTVDGWHKRGSHSNNRANTLWQ